MSTVAIDTASHYTFKVGEVHNNVLLGENDCLFLFGDAQDQFDFLTGEQKPAGTYIASFFDNLANRYAYC